MTVVWRMFTLYTGECEAARGYGPVRFVVSAHSHELWVGDRFDLSSIGVVAVDSSGAVVPEVPAEAQADTSVDTVFDLGDYQTTAGPLVAVHSGQVRLRFVQHCDKSASVAERNVEILLTVHPR
ncbi:hypothetical protein AAG565_15285 [Fontimonas sp. SYSU GA230001]|uniref:hypothetical protein n=1 Tax=Fontimonas sp. SYSU GA230001 TaxID=3142450 RepID=UPI0032B60502